MVLSLRDSAVESSNNHSVESIATQLEHPTDFLDQLRRVEIKNRRALTAREIQKLELEHNEFVMNYFVYYQQSNTVAEYENSILELKRWAETWDEEKIDEQWAVSRFITGLKEEIRKRVPLGAPDSLQRAIVLAKWQELCLVDKVFDNIPEPTAIEVNSEFRKESTYHEEIEQESSMKVNSICPLSLNSSCNVSVFAHFISLSIINDCGCQAFEKISGRVENSWLSKLKENGLYWGETEKIESTEFYFSNFLKPFLLNYDGSTMLVGGNFLCLGDVNELGLQEFYLEGEKSMEVAHKSLGLLIQNFIILFLWLNIFLVEAAMKTKVRQLCVIVNELTCTNFIEKTHHSDSRRLTLRCLGLGGHLQSVYGKDPILCFKKSRFGVEFKNTSLIKCKVVSSVDVLVALAKKTQLQTQDNYENLTNIVVISNFKESLRHNYQLGPYAHMHVPKASTSDNNKVTPDCDWKKEMGFSYNLITCNPHFQTIALFLGLQFGGNGPPNFSNSVIVKDPKNIEAAKGLDEISKGDIVVCSSKISWYTYSGHTRDTSTDEYASLTKISSTVNGVAKKRRFTSFVESMKNKENEEEELVVGREHNPETLNWLTYLINDCSFTKYVSVRAAQLLLIHNDLVRANIGDSRAFINIRTMREHGILVVHQLSIDHKPEVTMEANLVVEKYNTRTFFWQNLSDAAVKFGIRLVRKWVICTKTQGEKVAKIIAIFKSLRFVFDPGGI